jgi:hypothetical protein
MSSNMKMALIGFVGGIIGSLVVVGVMYVATSGSMGSTIQNSTKAYFPPLGAVIPDGACTGGAQPGASCGPDNCGTAAQPITCTICYRTGPDGQEHSCSCSFGSCWGVVSRTGAG